MKRFFERKLAGAMDRAMCGFMNGVQWRHRLAKGSHAVFEEYLQKCVRMSPGQYYAIPDGELRATGLNSTLKWESPICSRYPENNRVHAELFPSFRGWTAPTVLILHALMSASDLGYRRAALRFNELGWNACFVHLPYHYSRRPRGFLNGELAITSDLVHTAETLRQGVIELRQLMACLRQRGCREFGVLATSYGGWIAALLSFVEPDLRFLALMSPIVNVQHAIWESPAAVVLRGELRRRDIVPEMVERHSHLTSPLHNVPLCDPERALLVAGSYDHIALAKDIRRLHERWAGSTYLEIDQGHFGYRILPATLRALVRKGMLET